MWISLTAWSNLDKHDETLSIDIDLCLYLELTRLGLWENSRITSKVVSIVLLLLLSVRLSRLCASSKASTGYSKWLSALLDLECLESGIRQPSDL